MNDLVIVVPVSDVPQFYNPYLCNVIRKNCKIIDKIKTFCTDQMRALKHLEQARELLQPKLGFGAYKESPSDIKLVNMPGAIRGGKEYDVIIGYQITLQPIKVGQFSTTEPSNTDELARYLDEKAKYYVKKREKYHWDRDRMDAGEFDEVLGEIERNNDIFSIEEPVNRYDFKYKYGSYITAVIKPRG